MNTPYYVSFWLLVCATTYADSISFVNEHNGHVYGPFLTTSQSRIHLEEGIYQLVPIRKTDNALVIHLKTILLDSISVTNVSLDEFVMLLTKELVGKSKQPPGFVLNESVPVAIDMPKEMGITINMSMVSCYDLIEYVSECMGLSIEYDDSTNIVRLYKSDAHE